MFIINIFIIAVFVGATLAAMNVRIDTRYSPTIQTGTSNQDFAQKLKTYVENSPVRQGYCVTTNPSYPYRNGINCRQNGVSASVDIGYIWTFTFDDQEDARYQIDFGTDFGGGAGIFVDGVYLKAYQGDYWWAHNWNSNGVFRMDYNFTAGTHNVVIVGNDKCCDGDFSVQFGRNGLPKELLTEENFDCAVNNRCPVTCATNQYQSGRNCIDCSYKCATCQNNANTCLTCSSATRINAPSCNCQPGYYNVDGQAHCNQCHSSCETCSNGTTCDTCRSDQFLDGTCKSCTATYGSNCGTCNTQECLTCKDNPAFQLPRCTDTTCNSNEYKVNFICKQCHSSCQECVGFPQCTRCAANEYLQNGQCIACSTTFGANCGTCTPNICLTCANNPTFILPDCVTDQCQIGQVRDGNICRNCEERCEQCLNPTTCTKCVAGSYINNSDCPQCQSPCLTCENGAQQCTSCIKNNYTVESGCLTCKERFFETAAVQCASCQEYYGQQCGKCDRINGCTECLNNPAFKLPSCTSTECPQKHYADGNVCKPCIDNCNACSNGTTCDSCKDLTYKGNDGRCHNCEGPCFLCTSQTECTLCNKVGWGPPHCDSCHGSYLMHEGECKQKCPSGMYGDYLLNVCKQCDSECTECFSKSNKCTACPQGKVLHDFKCVKCEQIVGMYQKPGAPEGTCIEKCGDGFRVSNELECDDGNNIDGDGCSSDCKIEQGWQCAGGSATQADKCVDKRPIQYNVSYFFDDQYLNIEKNAKLKCRISFTKFFSLPNGTTLKDYILIKINKKNTSGFKIKVQENIKGRQLQESQGPSYDVEIESDLTLKNRDLQIDLYPKSAFDDGNGNNLAENEKPQTGKVKEYYYYNKDERNATEVFEFWLYIGVMAMMLFLPFYVFYYKNHFNKFYALFFAIDMTQILYFYRFINIRWPINGIKFFRKLKPTITFYMYNFYEKDISSDEFQDYSSGIKKFDLEKEPALFLNNVGSLITLFFIFIGLYLIVVLLSCKKLYCGKESKVQKLFFQLRYGYFQWGIWFDSMLASAGVFIIYIFLQMTNTQDPFNYFLAMSMGIFYFGFFLITLIYMIKNFKILYNKEMDEEVEDIPLEQKMQKNKTFKLRNIWHFIHKLEDYPKKAFFYYVYIFRKIYIAIVLLTLQDHETVQLSMFAFGHLVVILGLLKFTIFKENREKARLILSEFFVLGGLGCMYYMLDDISEDEHFRLKYSWFAISSLLLGLFTHAFFFCYQEFILPIIEYCMRKRVSKKVIDLRVSRMQGKQNTIAYSDSPSRTITSKFSSKMKKTDSGEGFNSFNKLQAESMGGTLSKFSKNSLELENDVTLQQDAQQDIEYDSARNTLPKSQQQNTQNNRVRKGKRIYSDIHSTTTLSNFSQMNPNQEE